jgi:hypothetical protein
MSDEVRNEVLRSNDIYVKCDEIVDRRVICNLVENLRIELKDIGVRVKKDVRVNELEDVMMRVMRVKKEVKELRNFMIYGE